MNNVMSLIHLVAEAADNVRPLPDQAIPVNDRLGASFAGDIEIKRLAKLGRLEYERQRKDAAERLNVRALILDRLVEAERDKSDIDGKQGRPLSFTEPEPWPDSIDGADLLDALSVNIRRTRPHSG
jgi:hypothetical protein